MFECALSLWMIRTGLPVFNRQWGDNMGGEVRTLVRLNGFWQAKGWTEVYKGLRNGFWLGVYAMELPLGNKWQHTLESKCTDDLFLFLEVHFGQVLPVLKNSTETLFLSFLKNSTKTYYGCHLDSKHI